MAPVDYVRRRKAKKRVEEDEKKAQAFKQLTPKNQELKEQYRESQKKKFTERDVEQGRANLKGVTSKAFVNPEAYEKALNKERPEQIAYTAEQENKKFKQEDVELLKQQVAQEEQFVEPSLLQQQEEIRKEKYEEGLNRFLKNYKGKMSEDEIRELFEAHEYGRPIPENVLKQDATVEITGAIRDMFGEVGQEFLGISPKQITDSVRDPTDLSSLTQVMSEQASALPAIEGAVTAGGIAPQRGLAELNSAAKDAEILQGNIDRLAVLRPELVRTKEYSALAAEIETYRQDIRDARATVLEHLREGEPMFNEQETQAYIEDLRKLKKENKKSK